MNLYLLERNDVPKDGRIPYDSYDSAVVAAESEDEARRVEVGGRDAWPAPKHVDVKFIGVASPDVEPGIVLASYNPA